MLATTILPEDDHQGDGLSAQREALGKLLSLIPACVYACDAEGRITFYNTRAVELWGRRPNSRDPEERFCGCYKMFRLDGTFVPREQSPMAGAVREGKPVRDFEAVIEKPGGSRLPVSINKRR